MKKIINEYKKILNNSAKYIVPTSIIMFCFILSIVVGCNFGIFAGIVSVGLVAPLFISTIDYVINHDL